MLRALQKELDTLALDQDKSFELQVRQRCGRELPDGMLEDLTEFIRMLPGIEQRIFALYTWLPAGSELKRVSRYFLAYMYGPEDFLGKWPNYGLFSYLDDVYLAAVYYELMLTEIQETGQRAIQNVDKRLLAKSLRLRERARVVIPEEADAITDWVAGLINGEDVESASESDLDKEANIEEPSPHSRVSPAGG